MNAEPERVSDKALAACEADNELFLSSAAVWEIAEGCRAAPLTGRPENLRNNSQGAERDQGMTLVTPDPLIEQYAVGVLW